MHKISLVLALIWLPGLVKADPPVNPVTLTYSTNPAYPPYDWAISENAFAGASIELLKRIVPPDVRLVPMVLPWKRSMALAKEGKIDLLVSIRITPERQQYLHFTSQPAFVNPIVVFVKKDKAFPFQQWSDLKGKTGGVSLGDYFGGGFDEYWRKELSMEEAPTMENNFSKLARGHIDYFVTSQYVGEAYLCSHFEGQIVALPLPISKLEIHLAFRKEFPNDTLLQYMDRKLGELQKANIPTQLIKEALLEFQKKPTVYEPQ